VLLLLVLLHSALPRERERKRGRRARAHREREIWWWLWLGLGFLGFRVMWLLLWWLEDTHAQNERDTHTHAHMQRERDTRALTHTCTHTHTHRWFCLVGFLGFWVMGVGFVVVGTWDHGLGL
jgi:hypothetical protein